MCVFHQVNIFLLREYRDNFLLQSKKGILYACLQNSQTHKAGIDIKGKRVFIQVLHDLGEWQTSYLRAHLLHKSKTKSNHPQQDQDKGQYQEFLLHFMAPSFGVHRHLLCGHPGSLTRYQLLSIADSFPEVMGHSAARDARSCTSRQESTEAPSWRSWAMWLITPGAHVQDKPVHCPSVGPKNEPRPRSSISLFPWDFISLNVGWTKFFLKMTYQLPKLPSILGGSTSQPIFSFLRLHWLWRLWSRTSPCAILI